MFQELTLLPNRTVAEILLIGREPVAAGDSGLDRRSMAVRAQAALDRLGVPLDAETPAARLSAGQRPMVEIARAAARDPKVLLLDEPASSLGRAEEELLFARIGRLRAQGVGMAHITHRMSEVLALSDRITVLRDGRHVATGPTGDFARGVDVGAKAEIDGLIRRLAADRAAVMVISSELPEVLQLSDRIAVMARGRVVGVVPAAGVTEEGVLELAFREEAA